MAGCGSSLRSGNLIVKYYYTQSDDGITIALRRYQPERLSADKCPIILCHGLSYNLLFWDLNEQVTLARYLARKGYDVWSLSLRGACPSSQPLNSFIRKLTHFHLEPKAVSTLLRQVTVLKMIDWSVDDHINFDIPAALDFVTAQTQKKQVHWIGHSMGGMIMLAYLSEPERQNEVRIRSLVAAATPMVVFHPLSKPLQFLLDTEPALGVGSRVVGTTAPATWGVIFGDLRTPKDRLFYNSNNMNAMTLHELFRVAEEEISAGQLKQLLSMVRFERFKSLDGKIDYTKGLERVNKPTLFLAGSVDNMATPGTVKYAYRKIAAQDKQFAMFGRVNSHRNDYGHNDIIIGKHAHREVYPVILKWLKQYPHITDIGEVNLEPGLSGPEN